MTNVYDRIRDGARVVWRTVRQAVGHVVWRWAAALTVGLVVNLAVYTLAVRPTERTVTAREQTWAMGRADLAARVLQRQAQADLEQATRPLLERKAFARLVVRVTELVRRHRLALPDVGYTMRELKDGGLAKVSMAFIVSGEYGAFRRFLSDVERAPELLTIEDLSLTKVSGKTGLLNVQVKLAAYLRTSASREPATPPVGGQG